MRKLTLLVAIAVSLAGCATRPPGCDGKDRRPVNVPAQAGITHPSCGTAA
ncbi:hypothetical protein [uncultured Massilia sp.]|nr:hypothetical protein [uncultured Massilia sp.]